MNQHFNFEVKKIIQTSDICRRNLNLIFFLHFPAKTGTLWWNRFCVGDRFYLMDNKILCEYDYEERLIFASMHTSAAAQIQRRVTDIQVRLTKTPHYEFEFGAGRWRRVPFLFSKNFPSFISLPIDGEGGGSRSFSIGDAW